MASILIMSSQVAASRVGGGAQAVALAGLGIETILIPTVIFGRHPGLGPPGGGPVPPALFEGVIEGVTASGALGGVDAVITGYFANAAQVSAAGRLIDAVRAVRPEAWIIVDPIMGDQGKGLYVSAGVADALIAELVSRADLIAPNAWELARIAGRPVVDAASSLAAARSLGAAVLVSSIPCGGDIGVLYAAGETAVLAAHHRLDADPKGAGDLLTAFFVVAVLGGSDPAEALASSVGQVASTIAGRPVNPDIRVIA